MHDASCPTPHALVTGASSGLPRLGLASDLQISLTPPMLIAKQQMDECLSPSSLPDPT